MGFFFSLTLDAPEAPASLKVTKVSPDAIDLKWTPPTKDGGSKVKGYKIYMATTPGEWTEVGQTKSFDEKFTVPNLTEGQAYYFAVAAENEAGLGPKQELDKPVTAEKPKGKDKVSVILLD